MSHEWIEVLNRRWCVCCTAYQQRPHADAEWPGTRRPCAQDTPYANNRTAISRVNAEMTENDRPLWPPGAELTAQAFDAFAAWTWKRDPTGTIPLDELAREWCEMHRKQH
jgi:hypothetical protein